MPPRCLILALALAAPAALAALGCGTLPRPATVADAAGTVTVVVPAVPRGPRHGWYRVREGRPSRVLLTRLTLPGLFVDHADEFLLARYDRVDADGTEHPPPEMFFSIGSADGRNAKGGFGYNGAINVLWPGAGDDAGDDAVVLSVSYGWTTPAGERGAIDEQVTVTVDTPTDVPLRGGGRLRVDWRAAGE